MTKNASNPAFRLYAAPVALLLMAGGLATQPASAETQGQTTTVQATFRYNTQAPATEIYAKLEQAANRICQNPSPRPLTLRKVDEACVASVMKDGVARIGRTDLAEVHLRARG